MTAPGYPPVLIARCRELSRVGWSLAGIRALLERDQTLESLPSRSTIHRWVSDEHAELHRGRNAEQMRRAEAAAAVALRDFRLRHDYDQTIAAYAQALLQDGMSKSAIGIALRVLTGADHSRRQVARILNTRTDQQRAA